MTASSLTADGSEIELTGTAGYHYEVLKFSKDSKKIIHTTINIGDYFIRAASLIENTEHDMVITCTYSKKANTDGTDGIFLALMDQSGKINKYKNGYYEFPLAELEKFESEKAKRKMEKKKDYEAPNLTVRNIVVGSDGSLFIELDKENRDIKQEVEALRAKRNKISKQIGALMGQE